MPDFAAVHTPKLLTIQVPVGSESVEIVFDANTITAAWMDLRIAEALPVAITGWNMTENGAPMPATVETFDRVPYPVLHSIARVMLEAATPSSEEGNASPASLAVQSSGTSAQGSVTSPNGSETVPSPVSSVFPSPI